MYMLAVKLCKEQTVIYLEVITKEQTVIYLEVITRLFSYRPVYQGRASIRADDDRDLDIGPI